MVDEQRSRWNFRVLLSQGVFKGVGLELSSEKLVLPFIYAALGGPLLFAGLLLSVVEIAKFAAQMTGATLIKRARKTKWYLGLTTTVSAAALAFICLVSGDLSPYLLVAVFFATASVMGLSSGFGALAFQDLLGRSLAEQYRGSLLFVTGSITGIFVIGSALGSIFLVDAENARSAHIELIWVGVGMMILASLTIAFVREPGKTVRESVDRSGARRSYVAELRIGMQTVARRTWFRRFLTARLLLLSVEVAMPFFAIHAAALHPDTAPSLSIFVIAGSVGMVLGGIVWPPASKASIRLVMSVSAILACLAAIGALTLQLVPALRSPMTHAGVFALLAFAVQGVTVGRTVYVVGAASDAERPYCISLSNLVAGVAGMGLAFLAGSIAQERGAIAGLLVMAPLNVMAALYARTLADIRQPDAWRPATMRPHDRR